MYSPFHHNSLVSLPIYHNSVIALPHQFADDVKLFRSNPGELTVGGNLRLLGSLNVQKLALGGVSLEEYVHKILEQQLSKVQKKD